MGTQDNDFTKGTVGRLFKKTKFLFSGCSFAESFSFFLRMNCGEQGLRQSTSDGHSLEQKGVINPNISPSAV